MAERLLLLKIHRKRELKNESPCYLFSKHDSPCCWFKPFFQWGFNLTQETDKLEKELIKKVLADNIKNNESISYPQFVSFLQYNFKQLSLFMPIFLVVGWMVWSTYAQPLLDVKIDEKIKPVMDKQRDIEDVLKEISGQLRDLKHDQKVIKLIQEKTVSKKVLDDVKKESDLFKN